MRAWLAPGDGRDAVVARSVERGYYVLLRGPAALLLGEQQAQVLPLWETTALGRASRTVQRWGALASEQGCGPAAFSRCVCSGASGLAKRVFGGVATSVFLLHLGVSCCSLLPVLLCAPAPQKGAKPTCARALQRAGVGVLSLTATACSAASGTACGCAVVACGLPAIGLASVLRAQALLAKVALQSLAASSASGLERLVTRRVQRLQAVEPRGASSGLPAHALGFLHVLTFLDAPALFRMSEASPTHFQACMTNDGWRRLCAYVGAEVAVEQDWLCYYHDHYCAVRGRGFEQMALIEPADAKKVLLAKAFACDEVQVHTRDKAWRAEASRVRLAHSVQPLVLRRLLRRRPAAVR